MENVRNDLAARGCHRFEDETADEVLQFVRKFGRPKDMFGS